MEGLYFLKDETGAGIGIKGDLTINKELNYIYRMGGGPKEYFLKVDGCLRIIGDVLLHECFTIKARRFICTGGKQCRVGKIETKEGISIKSSSIEIESLKSEGGVILTGKNIGAPKIEANENIVIKSTDIIAGVKAELNTPKDVIIEAPRISLSSINANNVTIKSSEMILIEKIDAKNEVRLDRQPFASIVRVGREPADKRKTDIKAPKIIIDY